LFSQQINNEVALNTDGINMKVYRGHYYCTFIVMLFQKSANSKSQFVLLGDKVIVWNDELPNPVYVRYAWADSPPYPNLHNKEGLPASPFRTDGF
jgi:hypothetical protein